MAKFGAARRKVLDLGGVLSTPGRMMKALFREADASSQAGRPDGSTQNGRTTSAGKWTASAGTRGRIGRTRTIYLHLRLAFSSWRR